MSNFLHTKKEMVYGIVQTNTITFSNEELKLIQMFVTICDLSQNSKENCSFSTVYTIRGKTVKNI